MPVEINRLAVKPGQSIFRRIMLYGDSNAGKTFLAGSAQDVPEMSDVLVANIDGGVTTLLSRGDIHTTNISGTADVEELIWMFARKDPVVASIKTIVFDGSTELQNLDLSATAVDEAKKNSKRDRDANELRDYMKSKNKLLRIYRMARNLPDVTVILTAWAAKKHPADNKTLPPDAIFPAMTESVRKDLVGYMDDCWYITHDPKTNNRYVYTSAYGPVFAKTRDAAVAEQLQTDGKPYLVNPTFSTIYSAYKRAYAVAEYRNAKATA